MNINEIIRLVKVKKVVDPAALKEGLKLCLYEIAKLPDDEIINFLYGIRDKISRRKIEEMETDEHGRILLKDGVVAFSGGIFVHPITGIVLDLREETAPGGGSKTPGPAPGEGPAGT